MLDVDGGIVGMGVCEITLKSDSSCMRAKRPGMANAVSLRDESVDEQINNHWM